MRDLTAVSARETMAGWYERYWRADLTAPLADLELASGSEAAFQLLRKHGIETAIVSITWSFAVDWFARRLGADYASARTSALVALSMSGRRTRVLGLRR